MSVFYTIRGRYTMAFSGLSIVFLLVVISTYALVVYLQGSVGKYAKGSYLIQNADRDLYQSRLALASLAFSKDESLNKSVHDDVISNAKQAYDRMNMFRDLASGINEIENQLRDFDNLYEKWHAHSHDIVNYTKEGRHQEAIHQFIGENQSNFEALRRIYDLSGELIEKYAAIEQQQINEYTNTFKTSVAILSILVLIVSIFLAWFAPKTISNAIKRVTFGVRQISSGDGDLTRRIKSIKKDETGELSRELDGLVEKLGSLIGKVRNGCEHIRQEMYGLSESATQSANLSERQNSSLEFVVTAVEEMGGTTQDVAQNAAHTVEEVEALNRNADEGVGQLDRTISELTNLSTQIDNAANVINELNDRSDQIASVLDVILGISEQTNLLALNAAIEAARAGEQGRGFAVVADEVRNLASETQASTADIQKMINGLQSGVSNAVLSITDSVKMAEKSMALSDKTRESISVVKQSANKIYDITVQTASATEEQSIVTNQINENLSSLSDMSKEILEISRTISQSVHETLSNSDELANQVKRFSV